MNKHSSDDASSVMRTFQALSTGVEKRLGIIALSSLASGVCEGALLVLIVHIATALTEEKDAIQFTFPLVGTESITTTGLFLLATGMALLRVVFQWVVTGLRARSTGEILQRERVNAMRNYLSASFERQDTYPEGHLEMLLHAFVLQWSIAFNTLCAGITGSLGVVALVGTAFVVNPYAASMATFVVGFLFIVLRPLSRVGRRLQTDMQVAQKRYGSSVSETVALTMEIQSFGVQMPVSDQLEDLVTEITKPYERAVLVRTRLPVIYQGGGMTLVIAGLALIGTQSPASLESLAAVVLLLVRSITYSQSVMVTYHTVNEIGPLLDEIEEARNFLEAGVEESGTETIDQIESISFREVQYNYPNGASGLERVDCEIPLGGSIGIVGPSGAGKSTFVQLLLGLRHPSDGVVELNGRDGRLYRPADWSKLFAYVPQDSHLFEGTVTENIRFYREGISEEDVVAAARAANVHDAILAMPQGYQTDLGPKGSRVSGGQRQRIAIARALAQHPAIIVLDEPTSALDNESEAAVRDTLHALKGDVTVVIIAHRPSTLSLCDQLLHFESGQLMYVSDAGKSRGAGSRAASAVTFPAEELGERAE